MSNEEKLEKIRQLVARYTQDVMIYALNTALHIETNFNQVEALDKVMEKIAKIISP